MSKFVIECPSCGKYTEASSGILGFFATKTIPCVCGYTIQVKTDKVASKQCVKCGNMVVYDQSKGEKALCPVCHEPVRTEQSMYSLVEFSCPSCSCRLSSDKGAGEYTCPLCETVIDVQNQIKREEIKNKGLASVIKYEGSNEVFVWKHPIEDFNLGSQLIVHESQEAIFFRDGRALDLFGAGRYTLATQNLPLLENLYKLPSNTDEVFHSEVYFINMATQMGIKWGTDSKIRLFDPASGLHIEIGAFGNFNIRVINSRKLVLKIVGTAQEFTQDEINGEEGYGTKYIVGKFKALIMTKVKSTLAKVIKESEINILEIDSYLDDLSEKLKVLINETLEEYGLVMPEFYIMSISTPDDDPNYRRLKQQFADKTLLVRQEEVKKAEAQAAQERKIVEAQTEAEIKLVGARTEAEAIKLKAEAEAKGYEMQAMAEAAEMRAKGYSYQQETARQVGLEAMQNGLTGGGVGGEGAGGGVAGMFGNIAELGVTLGAMGGMINMTKDALNPIMGSAAELGTGLGDAISGQNEEDSKSETGANTVQKGWNCSCGRTGITSNFCPDCGSKRPEEVKVSWDCECGTTGISSNFCPNCGTKRLEQ